MRCSNALCMEPAAKGDSWCRGCRYDFDASRVMRKPAKRGGPFGGETGGDEGPRYELDDGEFGAYESDVPEQPPRSACIDPWAEVR